ncbi:hypothetical protein EUTSA_v10014169mg [Eutrema salsugineum]|uniref:U-box domain-containing protein n=1 Tax=Eutrema salsugineum TaxID=72664 RepID=V4KT47_EUTSA|nr:E3 ubiquitin-protein ligase PUB23 [Eutrema salsugineum]ESQ41115.1 hypothetical protein EUTSA_v10014169mg [Eutrema salsugineum]
MMKSNQKPKPHAPPRPLFSCGFFRRCTQSVLSPTSPHQQPRRKPTTTSSSSSSSSTSTSQSFTQWRFPHHLDQTPSTVTPPPPPPLPPSPPPLLVTTTLQETFQIAELHLTSVSESDKLLALQLLERVVVPDPPSDPTCPPGLMRGLVSCLRSNKIVTAKYVTKILLALCLAEGNRHVAVEAGAARAVVETAAGLEISAVERALAALELMCTTAEGAAEVRAHAMTVPAMVAVMARLAGRGREYAISILTVVYGRGGVSGEEIAVAPAEEVARAVSLALEGECTARGRRKGAHLLKTLEEYGRLDLSQNGT